MKQLLAFIAAFILSCTGFAQVKVAHFNMDSLLSIMPEAIKANELIEERQKQLEGMRDRMQAEYDKGQTEYNENKQQWSPVVVRVKEEDLTSLQARMEMFIQQAAIDIEEYRAALIEPIKKKINVAAAEVAKVKGYAMVIDSSQLVVLYANPAYSIFDDICKELGIKK